MPVWIVELIQLGLCAIVSGFLYGFALWLKTKQTHRYLVCFAVKILVLIFFIFYLLNLRQLLLILIAVLLFLTTFWLTILKLERFW